MTPEADNPMTGTDFDWMVSNHAVWGWKAPVKASVSGVSLLQLPPFFASIFPLFPQKRLILRLCINSPFLLCLVSVMKLLFCHGNPTMLFMLTWIVRLKQQRNLIETLGSLQARFRGAYDFALWIFYLISSRSQ